jgi:hypothetical protein
MRREYTKEELELALSKNHTWSGMCKFFDRQPAARYSRFLKGECEKFGLDFSHFDPKKTVKDRVKYFEVIKVCPCCKKEFSTFNAGRKSRTFCSQKCSNSSFSTEIILKRNLSIREKALLRFPPKENNGVKSPRKYIPKSSREPQEAVIRLCCAICDKKVNKRQNKFCSIACSDEFKRISAANGTHSGWQSRNITSYPERFFKKVFELNGLGDKFILNAPVPKKSLGLDCIASYFLDFYFPHIKLDVEIDGKQHNFPERIASDKIRNDALIANGYIVYRIPWKNINNAKGKEFIRQEIAKLLAKIKDLERNIG